jgi:hypothetical protein
MWCFASEPYCRSLWHLLMWPFAATVSNMESCFTPHNRGSGSGVVVDFVISETTSSADFILNPVLSRLPWRVRVCHLAYADDKRYAELLDAERPHVRVIRTIRDETSLPAGFCSDADALWPRLRKRWALLHYGDERQTDDGASYYHCAAFVLRNYWRRATTSDRVVWVPLGWMLPHEAFVDADVDERPRASDLTLEAVHERAARLDAASTRPDTLALYAADVKNEQRRLAFAALSSAPADLRAHVAIHNTEGALGKLQSLWSAKYLQAMRSAAFVVSPSGNNNECFRTWEALAAGSVPIVQRPAADCLQEGEDYLESTPMRDHPLPVITNWTTELLPFLRRMHEHPDERRHLHARVRVWWLEFQFVLARDVAALATRVWAD